MHLLGISGTGFFFGTSWTGWDWFKSLLLIDKTSIDISLHMSSGQPRPHSSQNEFQEYFSSDDIPHVCVPLGNWRREELLDHLKPDVLGFWEDEIDDGREDEEDGAEHEESAKNVHIGLKRRVKLQREDEENAGDGSGEALAGGPHVRWEQLTGEDKRQGLDPKLDREDQKANCYKTSPLEHWLDPGVALLGQVVHQVGEGGEGGEADQGQREADEVHNSPRHTS